MHHVIEIAYHMFTARKMSFRICFDRSFTLAAARICPDTINIGNVTARGTNRARNRFKKIRYIVNVTLRCVLTYMYYNKITIHVHSKKKVFYNTTDLHVCVSRNIEILLNIIIHINGYEEFRTDLLYI